MTSIMCETCRKCRFKDTCSNKEMEKYGPAAQGNMAKMAMPASRKTDLRNIKIAPNTVVTIDLEELKEQMKKEHMNVIKGMFKSGA